MNPTPYTNRVQGIIQLELDKQMATESLDNILEEVISTRQPNGISRILLKHGNTNCSLPVVQAFRFGVEIARNSSKLIVALVGNPEISIQMSFLETVATNRGAQVKLFPSTREAESWLGSQYVA